MAGMGCLGLFAGLAAEREQLGLIASLEFLGLFMGAIFGGGLGLAHALKLPNDARRLEALRALWACLPGLPAGILLLYFRCGDVARTRLPALELWMMTVLSIALIVAGIFRAGTAWRLREEIFAFYRFSCLRLCSSRNGPNTA